ncbi:MAG: hypothetical protein FIA94_13075 [Nitrospirae bacterium]|nr:hypothetical protein [Nitrospirota bacterium]
MVRYILKSMNTVNLLLAAVLLLMVGYLILPLTRTVTVVAIPQTRTAAKPAESPQTPGETPSAAADYVMIADRNLFHPERIIPVEKKEEKPLPKPDFVLYGTLIDGDTQIAFMDDLKTPYTTPGRGKRQHSIAKGGNLSGFVLSEVRNDRVVMTRGEEKITVLLDDKQNKRTGPVETTAPAASAGQKPPTAARGARAAQPAQQPAAQQAQPYRQYQPETLRRNMRSIKQQPPRTTQPAQPSQPPGN